MGFDHEELISIPPEKRREIVIKMKQFHLLEEYQTTQDENNEP